MGSLRFLACIKRALTLRDYNHCKHKESFRATKIDVATAVAVAFLDTAVAVEQVKAAEQNVLSFDKFNQVVETQISTSLKPAADGYLSRAQLANAQNDLIRARLSHTVALARMATSVGLGGQASVGVDPSTALATADEPADLQTTLRY